MDLRRSQLSVPNSPAWSIIAIACLALIVPTWKELSAQTAPPSQPAAAAPATNAAAPTAETEAPKIPNDQLDSLVAPIALYPDPLLAQILAASTYPLEVIQLEQWMKRNPSLKDKALADAVAKQPWDPSVQSMAVFPDVVTRLGENVAWTTDLGNAFLAQQKDVMDAVQRMRAKAKSKGTLKTTEQQKVETQPVEGGQEVIVIEPANPQYVYVPSYDPAIVYGPPVYPYPPYYYPGYVPGMGLAFGTGLVLGAAWANNWGNCNWGHGDVTINNNNNFNRNNVNNINRGQGGNWQHNTQHRGGAPYGDRGTANKYGGRTRQQPAGGAGNRAGGSGGLTGNRPGGSSGIAGGNRPDGGGGGIRPGGAPGGGNVGGANRPGAGAGANRPSAGTGAIRPTGSGGNSIGNRSVSGGGGFGSSSNAFGGGGGFSGNSAGTASSRGGSSMGGGGFSRGGGGGGRGGGGGGGRRR
ncbi:MAG TPA: DUF3300 domain-containing protein [Chthoniobacterales bacterium]